MKTLKNYKWILSVVVFFLTVTCVYSYPPDNAAVLYYKAAVLYGVNDDEMANALADLQKDRIEPTDKIREFVKTNRHIIDIVLDATEVKNCDWGVDFSRGLDVLMPPLSNMRKLSRLVVADAKILATDGNYEAAINHYMSLYRMARHINDRVLISYLVGIAINGMTNGCVMQIMSDMPQDMQSMTRLKNQLIEIDSIPLSVKPALLGEREVMLGAMTLEQMPVVARFCGGDKSVKEKILSLDDAMVERNRRHFENYYSGVIAVYDMPYVKGYTALKDLEEKMLKDVKSNPDATLTGVLAPATHKIFSLLTRFETHNNAIKTAVEIYIIKAKTGKLPDELPAGLPKDLFSGKDFEYEKTAEGFILRCRGREMGKDKIHEYEFKVKK